MQIQGLCIREILRENKALPFVLEISRKSWKHVWDCSNVVFVMLSLY